MIKRLYGKYLIFATIVFLLENIGIIFDTRPLLLQEVRESLHLSAVQ